MDQPLNMAADTGRRATKVLPIVGIAMLFLLGTALALWVWVLSSSSRLAPPAEPAMLAMPESSLVYPSATNVQKVGQGAECRDSEWQPSLVQFTFTTNDSAHDLFVWYSKQLEPLGWSGPIPEAAATGYSLTRDTDDLYEIAMDFNSDGTPYRVVGGGIQFTTDFQHSFKTGRC